MPVLPALAFALLAVLTQPAQAQGFVPGFNDLPLMFELDADDTPMVFDAPGGRIIEARAQGSSSPARVLAFYRETLSQLGWRASGNGIFERDGERLRLDIDEPRSGMVDVRFSLAPMARF